MKPATYSSIIKNKATPFFHSLSSLPVFLYHTTTTCGGKTASPRPTVVYTRNRTQAILKAGAGGTYIDQYMSRLAETYLLRVEAYLGLNNTVDAAKDLNEVRTRANASPVTPGSVNLDYILDERLRELGIEEKRMLTLMRLGKWVERTRKCNPFYGIQMKDNYNLWPIPVAEIERNNKAVLEQNRGYN